MSETTLSTSLPQARVLVVDDHPGTATTLARAISQLGPKIEVVSATSGKMALEQVKEGAVDLLITDMMMPEMNGLQLIEKMQLHPGGRPPYTILITAYDVPGLKESARRLKVNETLIKPFRPEYIRQIVSKMLEDLGPSKLLRSTTEVRTTKKILVADDISDNVSLLSRYLVNEGYSIVAANNGISALELIRSEMPDLVLLDVNMPVRMDFRSSRRSAWTRRSSISRSSCLQLPDLNRLIYAPDWIWEPTIMSQSRSTGVSCWPVSGRNCGPGKPMEPSAAGIRNSVCFPRSAGT